MSAETILKISDLDISFRTNAGVVHAIRGVDMDLQKGETVAVVGESGSGKSVTMKAVMGLLGGDVEDTVLNVHTAHFHDIGIAEAGESAEAEEVPGL